MTPKEIRSFGEFAASRCHPLPPSGTQKAVCGFCYGPIESGEPDYCEICSVLWDPPPAVSGSEFKVIPISLLEPGDDLFRLLSRYRSDSDSVPPLTRKHARDVLAGLIGSFLEHRRLPHTDESPSGTSCVLEERAGRRKPYLVTIPTLQNPEVNHPLQETLERLPDEWRWEPLDVLQGTAALRSKLLPVPRPAAAHWNWYDAKRSMRGKPVLLVLDIWETGVHVSEAKKALEAAGADVTGAVVVGRIVDPNASRQAKTLYDWTQQHPFSLDRCCRCARYYPSGTDLN